MFRKGQRIPTQYQEGSYTKKRGRTVNVGKSYNSSTASVQSHRSTVPEAPPVPHRHYGDQNDFASDSLFDMDTRLPTEEEVRRSYGKVSCLKVCKFLYLILIPDTK